MPASPRTAAELEAKVRRLRGKLVRGHRAVRINRRPDQAHARSSCSRRWRKGCPLVNPLCTQPRNRSGQIGGRNAQRVREFRDLHIHLADERFVSPAIAHVSKGRRCRKEIQQRWLNSHGDGRRLERNGRDKADELQRISQSVRTADDHSPPAKRRTVNRAPGTPPPSHPPLATRPRSRHLPSRSATSDERRHVVHQSSEDIRGQTWTALRSPERRRTLNMKRNDPHPKRSSRSCARRPSYWREARAWRRSERSWKSVHRPTTDGGRSMTERRR